MIASIVLTVYALWIFYLAIMNLKRAKDHRTLHPTAKVLAYPMLAIGVLLDFICNMLIFTLVFVELPKEFLVTRRLVRHLRGAPGWRKNVAKWFCEVFLDTFDPSGCHCKN